MSEPTMIVCYAQCYACQFGQHHKPREWHTWADSEDIAHAKDTGQPDPSTEQCACPCAHPTARRVREGSPDGE